MNYRENRIHSSQIKPYSYYQCIIPDQFAYAPMHWHSEFEINFVRTGSAEFTCGEQKFRSADGDIIVIPPNVMHSVYPCPKMHQIYDTLVFSPELFGSSESDRCIQECVKPLTTGSMQIQMHITPKHHYYTVMESIVETVFACAKEDTPQLDMLLRGELFRFFWLLETEAEMVPNFQEAGEMIRPALEYIKEHFQENITIQQLAAVVHLSESYFMNQFQRHVGFTAIEYISHFRINQACRLLGDTRKSVLEVAFDCGFRNISNFNRQFRKVTGCSPTEYRKRMRTFSK